MAGRAVLAVQPGAIDGCGLIGGVQRQGGSEQGKRRQEAAGGSHGGRRLGFVCRIVLHFGREFV